MKHILPSIQATLMALLLLAIASPDGATAETRASDVVWVWSPVCTEATFVRLQVRFDGTTIHTARLPLCRRGRGIETATANFRYRFPKALVLQADREESESIAAGSTLEFDLWQAGGEAGLALLGYSLSSRDKVLLNGVHPLSPTRRTTTVIEQGLLIESWPVFGRQQIGTDRKGLPLFPLCPRG